MSNPKLRILNLYPRQLNIYGDVGNLLVLKKRAEWRSIPVEIINFEPGCSLDLLKDITLIIGGGGQDSGQIVAAADLERIGPTLCELIENNVPALVVCGAYQLFGKYLETSEGLEIKGIGAFDMHTQSASERQVGNIVTTSEDFGELVGYENHLGQSFLGKDATPLAKVVQGIGNNGEDGTEGARYKNALGTYLHGPLLPKNPQVADFLISTALSLETGELPELAPLPDTWLKPAREVARKLPR